MKLLRLAITVLVLGVITASGCGGHTRAPATSTSVTASTPSTVTTPAVPRHIRRAPPPRPPYRVRERTVTFIDRSRTIHLPGGPPEARRLVTEILYPANAPRREPLVVFGHGYAVTPRPYLALLRAWAAAGYVVAAPVFPLENAQAPGGPNEADLVNQPRDMSFVISRLSTGGGSLQTRIDPRRIAVTGQSDGGETALAVAYDRLFLDRRVGAAVILSGAKIPGVGGFSFPAPSPPLLATQGTADTVNPPSFTHAFFDVAPPPKYLLTLFGAQHLGPYTDEQPQLGIVERVSIAFLDRYLRGERAAAGRMRRAGDVPGIAALSGAGSG